MSDNRHGEQSQAVVPYQLRGSPPYMVFVNRFGLGRLITRGSSSLVHSGVDHQSFDIEVAIKISQKHSRLAREAAVFHTIRTRIRSYRGFARVYFCRPSSIGRMRSGIIVFEKLGQSLAMELASRASVPNRHYVFLTERTLEIARDLIRIVRYLHAINYMHTDINPTHVMFGGRDLEHKVYLIGLSAAKEIRDSRRRYIRHYAQELAKTEYSSAARVSGHPASRRDDMESIAYCLVAREKGSLPWSEGSRGKSGRELENYLRSAIPSHSAEQVCGYAGTLGLFLVPYLHYVRNLGADDEPDYKFLTNCLR